MEEIAENNNYLIGVTLGNAVIALNHVVSEF
jgi:hypothetical protein